jgi:hypothetical protein
MAAVPLDAEVPRKAEIYKHKVLAVVQVFSRQQKVVRLEVSVHVPRVVKYLQLVHLFSS